MATKIWRIAHDQYSSQYFSSLKKAYQAIRNEVHLMGDDEWEKYEVSPDASDWPSEKEMADGATLAGWWISRETVF